MTKSTRFPLLVLLAFVACAVDARAQAPAGAPAATAPARPSYVRPDLDTKWLAADGSVKYPANDGFVGKPKHITLKPGKLVDRFGGTSGHFFSPKGEKFDA